MMRKQKLIFLAGIFALYGCTEKNKENISDWAEIPSVFYAEPDCDRDMGPGSVSGYLAAQDAVLVGKIESIQCDSSNPINRENSENDTCVGGVTPSIQIQISVENSYSPSGLEVPSSIQIGVSERHYSDWRSNVSCESSGRLSWGNIEATPPLVPGAKLGLTVVSTETGWALGKGIFFTGDGSTEFKSTPIDLMCFSRPSDDLQLDEVGKRESLIEAARAAVSTRFTESLRSISEYNQYEGRAFCENAPLPCQDNSAPCEETQESDTGDMIEEELPAEPDSSPER